MVSNDVARLTAGEGCYAFLLDATGHVLADARILCTEESLLLDVEPTLAGFVVETLERYLIMERARIADVSDETRQLLIGGAGAADFLTAYGISEAASWREGQNAAMTVCTTTVRIAATHLLSMPVFDVYADDTTTIDLLRTALSEAGAAIISEDSLEALRIEAGVPRFGVDIDSRVLAPETGQEGRAISYRKGCYIGQEIVARIDARGRTNRGFTGFRFADGAFLPEADTAVVADGRDVGRITSAMVSPTLGVTLALGYLRHELAESGTKVCVSDKEAIVSPLPIVRAVTSGAPVAP